MNTIRDNNTQDTALDKSNPVLGKPSNIPGNPSALPDKPAPLSVHIEPLHHQVAGHVYDKKKAKLGFLGCADGTILKPLQSEGRGESELNLYKSVYDPACTSPTLLELRQLIPTFYGTHTLPQHPQVTYLHLEDMTAGMMRPCVADIKLGQRTYDPLAGPDKIAKEMAKYPPAKTLGFQFRGMRVYDAEADSFTTFGKEYLRSFDENTIEQAFIQFFTNGGRLRKDAVRACLNELRPVHAWFSHQTQLSFYASSLLIVYEGNPGLANTSAEPTENKLTNDSTLTNNCEAAPKMNQSCSHPQTLSENSGSECNGVPGGTVPGHIESGTANNHLNILTQDSHSDSAPYTHSATQCNKGETVNGPSVTANTHCTVRHDEAPGACRAVIRLIDFAHVFPVDHVDDNNLHGINTLTDVFHRILNK